MFSQEVINNGNKRSEDSIFNLVGSLSRCGRLCRGCGALSECLATSHECLQRWRYFSKNLFVASSLGFLVDRFESTEFIFYLRQFISRWCWFVVEQLNDGCIANFGDLLVDGRLSHDNDLPVQRMAKTVSIAIQEGTCLLVADAVDVTVDLLEWLFRTLGPEVAVCLLLSKSGKGGAWIVHRFWKRRRGYWYRCRSRCWCCSGGWHRCRKRCGHARKRWQFPARRQRKRRW